MLYGLVVERFVVVVFNRQRIHAPKLFGEGGTLRPAIRANPYWDVFGYARLRAVTTTLDKTVS